MDCSTKFIQTYSYMLIQVYFAQKVVPHSVVRYMLCEVSSNLFLIPVVV